MEMDINPSIEDLCEMAINQILNEASITNNPIVVSPSTVQPKYQEPSQNCVQQILTNIPEVDDEFDVPDYVQLETEPPMKLHSFINDHNYSNNNNNNNDIDLSQIRDHDYVVKSGPPCLTVDLRYFCNICSKNSTDIFSFNCHMRAHMVRNDISCPICSETFLTTSCLNNHMTSHMSICNVCDTWVPTLQIKFHIMANRQRRRCIERNSEKERVYFCIVCMKQFVQESVYLKHLQSTLHKFNVSKST